MRLLARRAVGAGRSALDRQSPRSAPGLQHTCPPRRRAAARRHPSHPRFARTGGEPGRSIRASADGRERGRASATWRGREGRREGEGRGTAKSGTWLLPRPRGSAGGGGGARRRRATEGACVVPLHASMARLPLFIEGGADGGDDRLGLLEDEPVLESQRPDAMRREDIVAGTIPRCRRVVVMRRAVEFDRERLGGAEEVEHMCPDRGLAPEPPSVDRASAQQPPQCRFRWGERASQRAACREAIEPVPETHRAGDCASRVDARHGAREGLRASIGTSPFSRGEWSVRDDRRWTARALARRLASSTIALPVAALPRGATPPIRASREREGSRAAPSTQARTGGALAWLLPRPRFARVGEVARAARRATEGACVPCPAQPRRLRPAQVEPRPSRGGAASGAARAACRPACRPCRRPRCASPRRRHARPPRARA